MSSRPAPKRRAESRRSSKRTRFSGSQEIPATPTSPDDDTVELRTESAAPPPPRRSAPGAGSRASRRSKRSRLRPSPAMIGALALVVAGVGAVGVSSASPPELGSDTYGALSADMYGSGVATRNNKVDVSRDFDRDLLAKQAEKQAEQRDTALTQLAKKTEKHAKELKVNQWVLPVAGYHLTGRFGESSYLWSSVHTGLDFAAPSGTPIAAVTGGTVTDTGYEGAYGNRTVVTLDDGTELWYCHQSSIAVSVGETVQPGDVIGYIGSTGNTTGPHLHLEVRPTPDDPIDPYTALQEHGVNP